MTTTLAPLLLTSASEAEHADGRTEPADSPSDLFTVREVARRLRVDETTVRRWIKSGILEAVALPHRGTRIAYRIRLTTINALLAGGAP